MEQTHHSRLSCELFGDLEAFAQPVDEVVYHFIFIGLVIDLVACPGIPN